jgi:hypothetical protein
MVELLWSLVWAGCGWNYRLRIAAQIVYGRLLGSECERQFFAMVQVMDLAIDNVGRRDENRFAQLGNMPGECLVVLLSLSRRRRKFTKD